MKRILPLSLLALSALVLTACETTSRGTGSTGGSSPTTSGADLPIGKIRRASEKKPDTDQAIAEANIKLGRSKQKVASMWSSKTFEDFKRQVPREVDTGYYIVNGDTVISDVKHLEEFFDNEVKKSELVTGRLVVHAEGGVQAVWNDANKRNLVYCISNDFGSRKNTVITAMANAAFAWEQQGDIQFLYSSIQDGNCTATNGQVVFDVRPVSNQPYLARAFFPNDVRGNRNVLIDNSSFSLSGNLSLEGILRHELGHTLGFRHEHTRPEAGTCFEDTDWEPLTQYDAFSVMHYPQCNGGGDWSLTLTDFDSAGIACLYGQGPGFSGDLGNCLNPPVAPPAGSNCGPQTVMESGSVGLQEIDLFGPYAVAEGTQFKVTMAGSGDPDLYVRFVLAPTLQIFDCRPYITGASETCDLTVPQNATQAHVMVRGYAAGNYQLVIDHTPSP